MDIHDRTKGLNFTRYVKAIAMAHGNPADADAIASARWGAASIPARIARGVAQAGQAGTGWASALAPEYGPAVAELFSLVREQSIHGQLAGLRRLPARTSVLRQTASASALWVAEGKAMPVANGGFERATLAPLKVAACMVVTDDLLASNDPAAELIIRGDLVRALVDASDRAFIDPANAGIADEQPAAVTYGAPSIADGADFRGSLERLVAGFSGDLTAAYLIARPELLVQVAGFDFPNVGARGGELAGIPTIASRNLPNDAGGNFQLALIDPNGIAITAEEAATQVKTSTAGAIEMTDMPNGSGATSTATSLVSLYQTNSVAIAALLHENWRVERVGSVALLTGIAPAAAPAS